MIYTRPFIGGRFIAYGGPDFEGDSWSRDLSLAVFVLDTFTGKPPQIAIRVRIKELPRSIPIRNQSGFFCFEGVKTPGPYTLILEPDRTNSDWYYLEPTGPNWTDTFERRINLPKPNPRNPLEEINLTPKTSYPFPTNATLVRGKVTQGTQIGVGGAIVSTDYLQVPNPLPNVPPGPPVSLTVKTLSDREGEFVLFFKQLSKNTQTVKLMAEKDGITLPLPLEVVITEGKTQTEDPDPKPIRLDLPV